jgi:hypothetical protein
MTTAGPTSPYTKHYIPFAKNVSKRRIKTKLLFSPYFHDSLQKSPVTLRYNYLSLKEERPLKLPELNVHAG